MVHQFCFSMFSTLPFAIGTVQDAGKYYPFTSDGRNCIINNQQQCLVIVLGLIFLSVMSHKIATSILNDQAGDLDVGGDANEEVVSTIISTTIVLLSLATASLGGVLILAGKFRFADAVAYLPLPVVGGKKIIRIRLFFAMLA